MFWEGEAIEFQKDGDKKLTNYDKSEEASFSVPSLSLPSSAARQSIFSEAWLSAWSKVLCKRTTLADKAARLLLALEISFQSERWVWSRDSHNTSTHRWSWWVHLLHLGLDLKSGSEIMMKQSRQWRTQYSQENMTEFLVRQICLMSLRQLELLGSIIADDDEYIYSHLSRF